MWRVFSFLTVTLAQTQRALPLLIMMLFWLGLSVQAQDTPLILRADTITIASGATPGTVTIQGAAGSVPGRTDVFAQNLFTGQAVTARANSAGAFTLEVGGTEITPFALNALLSATEDQRKNPASLPGDTGIIVWSHLPTSANGRVAFAAGGPTAYGAMSWWGEGDTLPRASSGDTLPLTLDIGLATDNKELGLDVRVRGYLALERIADENGQPIATPADLINGWTTRQTRAGLPVLSAEEPIQLGLSEVAQATRTDSTFTATLNFDLTLPANLPAGLYVPLLRGDIQVSDSEWSDWYANRVLSTLGTGADGNSLTRLPVALQIGAPAAPKMLWSLFQASSSDGVTGLLPVGTSSIWLTNQRRYSPITHILPPGRYPLDPYMPSLVAANASRMGEPRVPLVLPGGEYSVTITQPNAAIDRIAPQPFRQMTFENAPDQPPVVRLTTLDPLMTDYPFTMYGVYDLTTSGSIDDITGQHYSGGGAYRVLIAELIDLTPVMPLGMPFQEGDAFHAGLRLAPALPAEVTVTLRYFPLGQSKPLTFTTAGQASPSGVFTPGDAFVFEGAGEYVVDYEARYTDSQGRLWAASVREAGVVSSLDSALVAHGQRGLLGYDRTPLAWFDTSVYPNDAAQLIPIPYWPYNSGDLVLLPNRAQTGLVPRMSVQDTQGAYADWLQEQAGLAPETLLDASRIDALPTPYEAQSYAYLSAMTPSLAVRQMVQSSSALSPWSITESLTGQLGGAALRVGDVILLYGGIVTPNDTAGYAAVGLITDDDTNVEVVPPFTRPLAEDDDVKTWIDVLPLSFVPGQQINTGETLTLVGQVIPPLPANVTITLTSPSGAARTFATTANATGYFYNPQNNLALTEVGVWQVAVETRFAGRTSAGVVETPYTGRREFVVYVTSDTGLVISDPVENALQTPGQAMQIDLTVPEGWTDVKAFYTVRTDTALLDSGTLLVQTGGARYVYARLELAKRSTTLETDFSGDVVYLSFLFTGLDASGQPVARGRTYTVMNGMMRANPE